MDQHSLGRNQYLVADTTHPCLLNKTNFTIRSSPKLVKHRNHGYHTDVTEPDICILAQRDKE